MHNYIFRFASPIACHNTVHLYYDVTTPSTMTSLTSTMTSLTLLLYYYIANPATITGTNLYYDVTTPYYDVTTPYYDVTNPTMTSLTLLL